MLDWVSELFTWACGVDSISPARLEFSIQRLRVALVGCLSLGWKGSMLVHYHLGPAWTTRSGPHHPSLGSPHLSDAGPLWRIKFRRQGRMLTNVASHCRPRTSAQRCSSGPLLLDGASWPLLLQPGHSHLPTHLTLQWRWSIVVIRLIIFSHVHAPAPGRGATKCAQPQQ